MATMAVMAAIRANAIVIRVVYVRLFHQFTTPWYGLRLFFSSEGRSTTTGPVVAEPVEGASCVVLVSVSTWARGLSSEKGGAAERWRPRGG